MAYPATATIEKEQYYTKLQVGNHNLHADEPFSNGGQDLAPGPGEFLRMSLASCTAITLRMYANRKGFDVEKIQVTVSNEEVGNKNVYHRDIKIFGTLDETQRKRMLQVANLCPMHKVLTNPIEIETLLSMAD